MDLAACYRLMESYGMADMGANHISLAVPGEEGERHVFDLVPQRLRQHQSVGGSDLPTMRTKLGGFGDAGMSRPELPTGARQSRRPRGGCGHSQPPTAHAAFYIATAARQKAAPGPVSL